MTVPIAATSLMRLLDAVTVEALLIQHLRILPNADTSLFRKADRFFGIPPVPGPYKIHSIAPTLLYLSHKIVHYR